MLFMPESDAQKCDSNVDLPLSRTALGVFHVCVQWYWSDLDFTDTWKLLLANLNEKQSIDITKK